ncbi:M57 family metalloprotease [Sphingobacterium spiritivorum]|uniref:M57 family metalloprotease n=1 Tax=Sphingobacterium spiritivorum TaxID=258 RepID=UPI003DA3824C
MKKNKFLFHSLLFLILTVFSCQKERAAQFDQEQNIKLDSMQMVYKALVKLGFPTTNVSINGDTILVDDIILYKTLLLQDYTKTKPRQATARYWARLFPQNLTIYFPPVDMYGNGFTTGEVNIMKEGFNLFLRSNLNNGGGINSFYFHRSSNIGYHIKVNLVNMPSSSNTCGTGEYATSHQSGNEYGVRTGSNININLNYLRGRNGKFKLNREQLILLIAHEFGHTIGLRHTNWKLYGEAETDGTVGAYPVPGTVFVGEDNPDPSSIFNSSNCGASFSAFSEFDKIAIKYITNDAPTMIY